jgi:transcriptional regulator with XRE-family HTH domain
MNWINLIKQFRLNRNLSQMELAELCGVQQATVSRWESGKHIPDRATRDRLRTILRSLDSKSDQAIIRSVRYAHTNAGLTLLGPQRVIEISSGGCGFQGISRADFMKIPAVDWFMYVNGAAMAVEALLKLLKGGEVLAIHLNMEVPVFGTGGKRPLAVTFTPLWLSDGTFLVRGDNSVPPPGEYRGQSVKTVTCDYGTFEL